MHPGSRLRDGVRTGSRAAGPWHLSAPGSWPTGWVGSRGLQAAEPGARRSVRTRNRPLAGRLGLPGSHAKIQSWS